MCHKGENPGWQQARVVCTGDGFCLVTDGTVCVRIASPLLDGIYDVGFMQEDEGEAEFVWRVM